MKKVSVILTLSLICLCAGSAVAYYNTASNGYDNANLISFYDGGVYVLDFDFNRNRIIKNLESVKKRLPQKFLTI